MTSWMRALGLPMPGDVPLGPGGLHVAIVFTPSFSSSLIGMWLVADCDGPVRLASAWSPEGRRAEVAGLVVDLVAEHLGAGWNLRAIAAVREVVLREIEKADRVRPAAVSAKTTMPGRVSLHRHESPSGASWEVVVEPDDRAVLRMDGGRRWDRCSVSSRSGARSGARPPTRGVRCARGSRSSPTCASPQASGRVGSSSASAWSSPSTRGDRRAGGVELRPRPAAPRSGDRRDARAGPCALSRAHGGEAVGRSRVSSPLSGVVVGSFRRTARVCPEQHVSGHRSSEARTGD